MASVELRMRIRAFFVVTEERGLTVYDTLLDKIISVVVTYSSG